METEDYVHPEIGVEVLSAGGLLMYQKEERLSLKEGDVFYITGYGVVDRSCCGTSGCTFAFVPGIVVRWKYRRDEKGSPVSEVRPVRDEKMMSEIEARLKEAEKCMQVNFL